MRIEDEIKTREFKDPIQKAVVNLLYTSGWLDTLQARFLKPYGISSQQYNVLRILRGQHPNPASINLLIDRMLDKQSNASRLVEKLRSKGLVDRTIAQEDRRKVDVVITEEGLKLLKKLDKSIREFNEKHIRLSDEDAAQLSNLLDKFRG